MFLSDVSYNVRIDPQSTMKNHRKASMALAVEIDNGDDFMTAKVTGEASLAERFDVMDLPSDASLRLGTKRMLADLRQVKEDFKFTEHMSIGERPSAIPGHLQKVASIVPEDRRRGTSEQVAKRRGFCLRVFTSESEAVQWLRTCVRKQLALSCRQGSGGRFDGEH